MISTFNRQNSNHIAAWDVSAWLGPYPFRCLSKESLYDLRQRALKNQVEHVIVSGYDNLFAQNGLNYWEKWANILAAQNDASFEAEYWPVVNPVLTGELRRLEEGLRKWPCRGVRLLPSYHDYRAWNPEVVKLMALAREHDLIVQVFVRIADERWHWMHHQPAFDFTQDVAYLTSMFEQNQLMICGASLGELQSISSRLRTHTCLHADLSRVRGPVFAMDHVVEILPLEKLVFGSLWPVQILEATLWEITSSRLSSAQQHAILQGNARRLIQPGKPIKHSTMEPVS